MKILFFLALFFVNFVFAQDVNFYAYIQKSSRIDLEEGIKKMEALKNDKFKEIYKGALIAKTAPFEKTPKNKVERFKLGVKPIEDAISKQPENIELRFIRLIIQENSPAILKYKGNLKEDKIVIEKGIKSASKVLRENIEAYSKSSQVLKI